MELCLRENDALEPLSGVVRRVHDALSNPTCRIKKDIGLHDAMLPRFSGLCPLSGLLPCHHLGLVEYARLTAGPQCEVWMKPVLPLFVCAGRCRTALARLASRCEGKKLLSFALSFALLLNHLDLSIIVLLFIAEHPFLHPLCSSSSLFLPPCPSTLHAMPMMGGA